MSQQLSLFAAGELPPAVDDLEGLLAGPGHLVRRPDAARLSVLVAASWRVAALLEEFAERGLVGERVETPAGRLVARTAFSPRLQPMAARWARGARILPPAGWRLDGPRLRLWTAAAGHCDDYGYLLPLADDTDAGEGRWSAVGAALHDAGVPGTLVGPRAGGPAYRFTGKRLTRLAELVGGAPAGAPVRDWPA